MDKYCIRLLARKSIILNLFFDGASRGNPGAERRGGVICNPGGSIVISYAWGLGTHTNNEAKPFSLYAGIKLALSK
jgi:ribonuclease HI